MYAVSDIVSNTITAGTYAHVAFAFSMHRSTVALCLHQVLRALSVQYDSMFENAYRDIEGTARMEQDFYNKYGVPGVIGVIDGSHIPTYKYSPNGERSSFYNRKGWKSIILQAIVDARGRFVNIDVGEKGSRHEAYVFSSSSIGKWFETAEADECVIRGQKYLLGDGAYRLQWYMMKAFDHRSAIPSQYTHTWKRINSKINSTYKCNVGC